MQDAFWLAILPLELQRQTRRTPPLLLPFSLCVGVQQNPGMAVVCGRHSMRMITVKTMKCSYSDLKGHRHRNHCTTQMTGAMLGEELILKSHSQAATALRVEPGAWLGSEGLFFPQKIYKRIFANLSQAFDHSACPVRRASITLQYWEPDRLPGGRPITPWATGSPQALASSLGALQGCPVLTWKLWLVNISTGSSVFRIPHPSASSSICLVNQLTL